MSSCVADHLAIWSSLKMSSTKSKTLSTTSVVPFRSLSVVEPLVVGSSRHPSSAFCILYLLACKRLTFEEVTFMLHYMVLPRPSLHQ